jgi:hypothetical protein
VEPADKPETFRRKYKFSLSAVTTLDESCARMARDMGRSLSRVECMERLARHYLDTSDARRGPQIRMIPRAPAAPVDP